MSRKDDDYCIHGKFYLKNCKDCEELESLRKDNAKMREALEFYADNFNYTASDHNDEIKDKITFSDVRKLFEEPFMYRYGGHKARECLASLNFTETPKVEK